jgi:hypothetical protein
MSNFIPDKLWAGQRKAMNHDDLIARLRKYPAWSTLSRLLDEGADAIAALVAERDAAVAAHAQPSEPVAWVNDLSLPQPHCVTDLKYCSVWQWDHGDHLKYVPLYAAPPSTKPLTLSDDDISEILLKMMPLKDPYAFARAVLAAAQEKP